MPALRVQYDGGEGYNQYKQMQAIENPYTKNEFLRYVVGTQERRPAMVPIYVNQLVQTHRESDGLVDIFMVRGFGKTLDAAHRMARLHGGADQ